MPVQWSEHHELVDTFGLDFHPNFEATPLATAYGSDFTVTTQFRTRIIDKQYLPILSPSDTQLQYLEIFDSSGHVLKPNIDFGVTRNVENGTFTAYLFKSATSKYYTYVADYTLLTTVNHNDRNFAELPLEDVQLANMEVGD